MDEKTFNSIIGIAAFFCLGAVAGFAFGAPPNGCATDVDAHFGCVEFFLARYQTAIGIAGALIAAKIAARPVWQQLVHMQTQSQHLRHDALQERSIALASEEVAIIDLTKSALTVHDFVERRIRPKIGPTSLVVDQSDIDELSAHMAKFTTDFVGFRASIGQVWGNADIQAKRRILLQGANQIGYYAGQIAQSVIGQRGKNYSDPRNLIPALKTEFEKFHPITAPIYAEIRSEQGRLDKRLGELNAKII